MFSRVILLLLTANLHRQSIDTSPTHQYPIQDYSYSLQTVNQTPDSVSIYLYNKLVRGNVNHEYNPSFVRLMLLVLGGIETNPGPRPPKYPCAICGKACKWGQKAIACDSCDHWYHIGCTGINSSEYSYLANTSVSWYCVVCHEPNHSTILYDLIDSNQSNSFSVLSDGRSTENGSITDAPDSPLGEPIATSSPKRGHSDQQGSDKSRKQQKRMLRTLIINFQSVKNKTSELQVLLDSTNPDILIGTETWLSESIYTSEIFPPSLGYDVIRRDRPSDPHGGVLLAAKTELGLTQLYTSKESELIAGSINISPRKKITVVGFYRPPNRQEPQYLHSITEEINTLRTSRKSDIFLLGGDFNLPDIDWHNNNISGTQNNHNTNETFLHMSADLNIQQVVDKPTRGDNTLDLLFTSHPGHFSRCKTLPPIGNSDHDIVFIEMSTQVIRPKPQRRTIYLWKKADMEGVNSHLSDRQQSFLDTTFPDVDSMWAHIKSLMKDCINKHVPTRRSLARHTHPWMNTHLRRLSNKKQRAYTKARKGGRQKDWARYNRLKAELQREMRTAHTTYMEQTVSEDLKNNPKQFWSYIKSRKQDSSQIVSLKSKDGFLHSDTETKASILNDQFQSVYTREDLSTLPDMGQSHHPTMNNIKVHERGVEKLFRGLRPHKATGPDEIPAFILKAAAGALSPYFTRLYQMSLDSGKIPDDWRTANIVPIYKKGEKHLASNYRPVSLTSIACKLLEHIVHSTIKDHFDTYNILCDEQHGFRARRSTETQLIQTIHHIAKNLDDGDQTDIILLDFSKAFDKVPHRRLLHKMSHYGVRGTTLRWIEDFLHNRFNGEVTCFYLGGAISHSKISPTPTWKKKKKKSPDYKPSKRIYSG